METLCPPIIQTPKSPTGSGNADLLRVFRGEHHKIALRLHPLEKALVAVVGLHLCFLPWALGTMHVWSQIVSFVFSITAFVLSLWPRNYTSDYAREGNFRLLMWPRLLRFPLTWIGLVLLGYVLIQALNPAWDFFRFPNGAWAVKPLASIAWLPHGMRTPFAMMNPWRMLMIYASAWLLICALWVGITRRNALQALMAIVIINGTALAVMGLIQRLSGIPNMFFGLNDRAGYFFATIIYKNHAGAYFNLILGVIAAAFAYSFARQARRMDRSGPAPVLAFCALIVVFAVLQTYSRAAALLMGGFLAFGLIGFIRQLFAAKDHEQNRWVLALMTMVFVFFILLGVKTLNLKSSTDRVGTLFAATNDYSVTSRQQLTDAGLAMAKDDLITGWGAGGFRFRFPVYQMRYPHIWAGGNGTRFYWEHTHNDFIETLIELGLIGSGIIVTGLAYSLYKFTRHRGWSQFPAIVFLLGLALTVGHAWADFPFQNPAILLTWSALVVMLLRWLEIEDKPV